MVRKTQLEIPLPIRFAEPIVWWHSAALAAAAAALQAPLRAGRFRVSGSGGANRIGRKIPLRIRIGLIFTAGGSPVEIAPAIGPFYRNLIGHHGESVSNSIQQAADRFHYIQTRIDRSDREVLGPMFQFSAIRMFRTGMDERSFTRRDTSRISRR
jgi:hypothetical protein